MNRISRIHLIVVACAALLFCGPAFAEELAFNFNPAQTRIEFTVGDILHTVHGTFLLKSGFIQFDTATGAAQGLIVVDAASGNSGSNGRDHRMHQEILESERYPEIRFAPNHVQGQIASQGESQLAIDGLLTLHGTQHLVTIVARVNPAANLLNAESQFDIPYVKWGLKNPSTFILRVSSTVKIHIQAAGRLEQEADHP